MNSSRSTEASRLLDAHEPTEESNLESEEPGGNIVAIGIAVLPVPLLAALAMAATAATTIYAYADLMCKDATRCKDTERNSYARTVAVAMTIANICPLLTLGTMAKISKRSQKVGLVAWIVCRSMSVAVLALGVQLRSIGVAICGQIFDGLASDNILHFNLNAIYVQAPRQQTVSRLIRISLALFMIGISVSPAIAGLLPDFRMSFAMAVAWFAMALIYLLICVPNRSAGKTRAENPPRKRLAEKVAITALAREITAPLTLFTTKPLAAIPGVALFLYNLVQSYSFAAIMVHASLDFGFSGKQNGFLLSVAHAVASISLLLTLSLGPLLMNCASDRTTKDDMQCSDSRPRIDALLALSAMLIQAMALLFLGFAYEVWQIYASVALYALGLATPSFVKAYFVTLLPKSEGPRAVAALTMMETLGGLVAPVILGGIQSLIPGKVVFLLASGCVALAALIFGIGFAVLEVQIRRDAGDNE